MSVGRPTQLVSAVSALAAITPVPFPAVRLTSGFWTAAPAVIASAACTLALAAAHVEDPIAMIVHADFAVTSARLRPLHGINKGPLIAGGLVDITKEQAALAPPYCRLHDCHWPNPDVVDFHAVFPNPDADPSRPESYDFERTDAYVAGVRATGAKVIYRLGESIEHTDNKYWVNPPKDPAKWAQVAVGIIRHYNEGWANGHRWGIRHWEIWNEPENRPSCWTGTDEQFVALYAAAARAIKQRFPDVEVGGPGVGYTGRLEGGELKDAKFIEGFLAHCRDGKAPLDFFSWHCYTAVPVELVQRARGIRALLDAYGFARTKTHLTEWNYLPGNSWDGFGRVASASARHTFISEMSGRRGAAFTASALILLQEAPVDVSCFYHAEVGQWGVLSMEGVPEPNYYALRSFREMADMPARAQIRTEGDGAVTATATIDASRRTAGILVATQTEGMVRIDLRPDRLPWSGASDYDVLVVDGKRSGADERQGAQADASKGIAVEIDGPGFAFVRLRAAK